MKEDVLKKAVEFNKQREKLLGTLRKTLHITDPHFRPTSVREESTEGVLTIVGSGGSFVSARFESSLKITRTDGKGDFICFRCHRYPGRKKMGREYHQRIK